jgi:hypothetical protein
MPQARTRIPLLQAASRPIYTVHLTADAHVPTCGPSTGNHVLLSPLTNRSLGMRPVQRSRQPPLSAESQAAHTRGATTVRPSGGTLPPRRPSRFRRLPPEVRQRIVNFSNTSVRSLLLPPRSGAFALKARQALAGALLFGEQCNKNTTRRPISRCTSVD